MLSYQLDKLQLPVSFESIGIYKTFISISARSYKWNLCPYDETITVHQIIHVLRLRVMCQPHGIHTHFGHNCCIFFMMTSAQYRAFS